MLHYPLCPRRKHRPMLKLKPTKTPGSLKKSNTSMNKFMIFCISPIPSTRNSMINTRCHTSFKWEIKFRCICKKNSLHDPIRIFVHSTMDLTPSPSMWVTILLSSTFLPSLDFTHCLMWTPLNNIFHHYWTPER
jgi:hypothetical protein